jgi:hypothetical protein
MMYLMQKGQIHHVFHHLQFSLIVDILQGQMLLSVHHFEERRGRGVQLHLFKGPGGPSSIALNGLFGLVEWDRQMNRTFLRLAVGDLGGDPAVDWIQNVHVVGMLVNVIVVVGNFGSVILGGRSCIGWMVRRRRRFSSHVCVASDGDRFCVENDDDVEVLSFVSRDDAWGCVVVVREIEKQGGAKIPPRRAPQRQQVLGTIPKRRCSMLERLQQVS